MTSGGPSGSGVRAFVAAVLAVEGGLAVAAVGLGALLGAPPLARLQGSLEGLLWGGAALLPTVVLLRWTSVSVWWPAQRLRELTVEMLGPVLRDGPFVVPAAAVALGGVVEEACFRGVLQTALAPRIGVAAAIAAVAVLFGLMHAATPLYAVAATALGGFWGALLALTGDLAAPMTAHALHNVVALLAIRALVRRRPRPAADPVRPRVD